MTTAKDGIARDPTVLDGRAAAAPAGDGDLLAAGHAAGEYVVERRLGGGAMGDVYAGRHPVIGKKVAIKVLKRDLAGRADAAERFLREARAVNQIDHPNVVDVFALGRLDDGRLYLVMDLLDGESLRARLARGAVAPAVALAILGQIAAALDAAHGRGVIHRDLKPDNIVLTGPAERPTAHVLDFGIAKLVADAAGERVLETLTGQGAWLGTPAYMAPEQWSADGATAASDRYALGIVAFELLTGTPPFVATTLPGMMEQHFRAAVPSVTSTGAALHPSLDRVFARALAKAPEARPATAAALVAELEAALGGRLRVAAATPRGRGAWLAGAAGLAVVVAGGVLVIGGGGRERGAATGAEPTPRARAGAGGARIQISSTPAGAQVRRGEVELGVTPLIVDARPGETVTLTLAKPGYAPVHRTATAGASAEPVRIDATLALVTGFEGVWALPDGKLRQFERRGEQVAGFRMRAASGPREFLRMFEFLPTADSGVAFTATEPHVDERAPDEPSCNIPLRAEYRYHPADDSLELRAEQAQYTLTDGHCVLQATVWSDARPLARVAGAPADAVWAESRAGAGVLDADDAAAPPPVTPKPVEPKAAPKKVVPRKGPLPKAPRPKVPLDALPAAPANQAPVKGALGDPPPAPAPPPQAAAIDATAQHQAAQVPAAPPKK